MCAHSCLFAVQVCDDHDGIEELPARKQIDVCIFDDWPDLEAFTMLYYEKVLHFSTFYVYSDTFNYILTVCNNDNDNETTFTGPVRYIV